MAPISELEPTEEGGPLPHRGAPFVAAWRLWGGCIWAGCVGDCIWAWRASISELVAHEEPATPGARLGVGMGWGIGIGLGLRRDRDRVRDRVRARARVKVRGRDRVRGTGRVRGRVKG